MEWATQSCLGHLEGYLCHLVWSSHPNGISELRQLYLAWLLFDGILILWSGLIRKTKEMQIHATHLPWKTTGYQCGVYIPSYTTSRTLVIARAKGMAGGREGRELFLVCVLLHIEHNGKEIIYTGLWSSVTFLFQKGQGYGMDGLWRADSVFLSCSFSHNSLFGEGGGNLQQLLRPGAADLLAEFQSSRSVEFCCAWPVWLIVCACVRTCACVWALLRLLYRWSCHTLNQTLFHWV